MLNSQNYYLENFTSTNIYSRLLEPDQTGRTRKTKTSPNNLSIHGKMGTKPINPCEPVTLNQRVRSGFSPKKKKKNNYNHFTKLFTWFSICNKNFTLINYPMCTTHMSCNTRKFWL